MKRLMMLCVLASLLLPFHVTANERSALHQQRTQTLRGMSAPAVHQNSAPATHSAPVVRTSSIPAMVNDATYQSLLIKSRATLRPLAHNGRVMYNAVEIRDYVPGQTTGMAGGNLITSGRVQSIYNVTTIRDPNIRSLRSDVELGNLTHYGQAGTLVNIVDMRGNIMSRSISMGNVTNVGNVQEIFSAVNWQGNGITR